MYAQARRSAPVIHHCASAGQALAQLADESFDCVLIVNSTSDLTRPGIDAHGFCIAARAGGCTDALLIVTAVAGDALWRVACETESEVFVSSFAWQSSAILLFIDRTIQRRSITRDTQRRHWAEGQRVDRERDECSDLLRQQRQLLNETPTRQLGSVEAMLPAELPRIYREVLRTYVMTGTANLATEIKKLAQTFALAHLTPRQVLQLHLDQVELLVKGIGQRSARHIVDRANVLCLELMVLLCECFEEQNARTWWAWRRQPVSDFGVSLERRAA